MDTSRWGWSSFSQLQPVRHSSVSGFISRFCRVVFPSLWNSTQQSSKKQIWLTWQESVVCAWLCENLNHFCFFCKTQLKNHSPRKPSWVSLGLFGALICDSVAHCKCATGSHLSYYNCVDLSVAHCLVSPPPPSPKWCVLYRKGLLLPAVQKIFDKHFCINECILFSHMFEKIVSWVWPGSVQKDRYHVAYLSCSSRCWNTWPAVS